MGISRTPQWNVWNGGHEWANHPLREALISNYLIKICLRRGASYAPFGLVLHLLLVPTNVVDRVFKGSEVDLTSRQRYEGPKRKEATRGRRIYMPNLRFDEIKTVNRDLGTFMTNISLV